MKTAHVLSKIENALLCIALGMSVMATGVASADPISAELHTKVDKYKKHLVEWAANPQVIAAVKESNNKGGVAGMTNAKWDELADSDAIVNGLKQSGASKLIAKWEEDKALDKLFLRDEKGNLVAFSSGSGKPILYNNANRPPFQNGLKGAWAAGEVKPDPTTQKKTVQISAPVLDGGKAIGVLQSAVVAE